MQPLSLPSPLVPIHSLKAVADAIPELGHNDVAIAFCYDDANLVTVNECGERYQSTCTGSNGQGECCSSAGKCGSEEAHRGAGMQEEFSHGKNLCEEGEARDGFDQQAAADAGLQQAQDQQAAVAVIEVEKNAADLKALMALLPTAADAAAISMPDADETALDQLVDALRAAGEVVVNCLSGKPDPRCDRQLVEVNGDWQVQPLNSDDSV